MFKKSFAIPYEDNLKYPTVSVAQALVAQYCEQNKLSCTFEGQTEDGNSIAKINGVLYEVRRGLYIGQCGPGGHGISCREL